MVTLQLLGGPFDGATCELSHEPQKREGELEFGGLTYWADLDKGTATFIRGVMDKRTQLFMRRMQP